MDSDRDNLLKRQKVLADFGDFALQSESLDEVLAEACRLVAEAMATGRAKVLEIETGGGSLVVRAGVGWDPCVVGHVRLSMDDHTSESFSIREKRPVISQDIGRDERFRAPSFLKEAGVVSIANVPILLPGGRAFGLLQVDATELRNFSDEDTEFLRTYATILGPIVDRLLKVSDLRASEERFRFIVEEARDYAIFITDTDNRISGLAAGGREHLRLERSRGRRPAGLDYLYAGGLRGGGAREGDRDRSRRGLCAERALASAQGRLARVHRRLRAPAAGSQWRRHRFPQDRPGRDRSPGMAGSSTGSPQGSCSTAPTI